MAGDDWQSWAFWTVLGVVMLVVLGVWWTREQAKIAGGMADKFVEIADELSEMQREWTVEMQESASEPGVSDADGPTPGHADLLERTDVADVLQCGAVTKKVLAGSSDKGVTVRFVPVASGDEIAGYRLDPVEEAAQDYEGRRSGAQQKGKFVGDLDGLGWKAFSCSTTSSKGGPLSVIFFWDEREKVRICLYVFDSDMEKAERLAQRMANRLQGVGQPVAQ